jgi:polyisoprenoid-binding protein YceI
MIKVYKKWIITLLASLIPIVSFAEVPSWQVIPTESKLSFTAIQNDAPVTGEFKTFTGKILVDPQNYKNSSIDIIVDINSLTSSYSDVTKTLITPEWFNAKLFPKAEFKATDFEKTGDKTYQAKGTLTIRDKSAPVTLTFTADQPSPDKGVVKGSTVIKRTAFGVGQGEWADTKTIKDNVKVDFIVTAVKK